MGNQHSASHAAHKPRKNVHWKSAGRPAVPGKPEVVSAAADEESTAVTLRWGPAAHDGGAPLLGYQVECQRLGTAGWLRTAPPLVRQPELLLTGLQPPHRYQFRVAAVNAVGRSDYSALSDVVTVGAEHAAPTPPAFLQMLQDVTALENDKTEFQVQFTGTPMPTIAWFKDGYEIFSSRRTAITTEEMSSVLVFHQTLATDEGEIKCTATNRAGHAVTRARLSLEAAPKLRYPRQYEEGLLYEINETVFLKTSIVGKPTPTVEWRHDGQLIIQDDRIEITNTPKFTLLKIQAARRTDRGEYQVHAKNSIGEDTAAFLVTVTAPPEPPRHVSVTRQLDKSVTLAWEPPEDDGGCRIGNYVLEYYRTGWNVWLKATTSRKTNITLFDLIEGSEYRFRVKAESPYGMSAPSVESAPVRIPGRAVDMEFLAVESRIISDVLLREDGEEARVSPVPRRRRAASAAAPAPPSQPSSKRETGSNEFMLVLYPDTEQSAAEKAEKRKSFQLDLEDALSPPPISLSAPELSSRCTFPFKSLRNAVSSTELLHERAMARFYKAVAMKEEQSSTKQKENDYTRPAVQTTQKHDIPLNNHSQNRYSNDDFKVEQPNTFDLHQSVHRPSSNIKAPEIYIKTDSIENKEYKYNPAQISLDSETSESKWQNASFEEDYTASTVTTDEEYSDEGSFNGDLDRMLLREEETYNPRGKLRPSSVSESIEEEEESEREPIRPLPLPDPNFVPKPILKKRDSTINEVKVIETNKFQNEENTQAVVKPLTPIKMDTPKPVEKVKKEQKMTLLKKITKMPVQKTFGFPKILNKKETVKLREQIQAENPNLLSKSKSEETENKLYDEGRSVIDYYSNIVKEYGSQKKAATPLYLNTEELKSVAEKQQMENKNTNATKVKKVIASKQNQNHSKSPKNINSVSKQAKQKLQSSIEKPKSVKKDKNSISEKDPEKKAGKLEKVTQQIVLKKAERATIVIPIDYQELEEKAKENVRSAIDYMVDVCLLCLAFWVYFFKDERLAIPFLVLIIYRQLQETLLLNIPAWVRRHTPEWLKKKTS